MIDVLLRRRRGHQRPQPMVGGRLRRARQRGPGTCAVSARAWCRPSMRTRPRGSGCARRSKPLLVRAPALVHARGGDGQTPLHFASTVEVAQLLIDRGADIDARDVDHESTPAQYMVRDRQDVARYLVARGCRTDILMAAALGDLDLVRQHLDADPGLHPHDACRRRFSRSRTRRAAAPSTRGRSARTRPRTRSRASSVTSTSWPSSCARSPATLQLAVAGRAAMSALVQQLLATDPTLVCALFRTTSARRWLTRRGTTTCVRSRSCSLPAGRSTLAASIVRRPCTGPHGTATSRWRASCCSMARLSTSRAMTTTATPLHWASLRFGARLALPDSGDYAGVVETSAAGGCDAAGDRPAVRSERCRARRPPKRVLDKELTAFARIPGPGCIPRQITLQCKVNACLARPPCAPRQVHPAGVDRSHEPLLAPGEVLALSAPRPRHAGRVSRSGRRGRDRGRTRPAPLIRGRARPRGDPGLHHQRLSRLSPGR